VVLGWLLPFLALIGIPVLVLLWLRRTRGRRTTPPPAA
jgi:hypothetical protein